MMRRYRITHTTSLTYDSPVRASHNELRMTPLNEPGVSQAGALSLAS